MLSIFSGGGERRSFTLPLFPLRTVLWRVGTTGGTHFQVANPAAEAAGLVVGEVTTIATEPACPLPEADAPLVKLLDMLAARIGPQNFPAETHFDDASWVGYRLESSAD